MRICYRYILIVCVSVGAIILFSCSDSKKSKAKLNAEPETVVLAFSFEVDKEVCLRNKYKRTPQFAIWLENAKTGDIRTVCVTNKTAKGKWAVT